MATHQDLLEIVKKLPSDFQPFGERDRDTAEPWQDCSCGCRHFVPLAGELGYDWGVCVNPASPRCGLLTFEHQGCPQFEPEAPTGTSAAQVPNDTQPAPIALAPVEAPGKPSRKLKVDFQELLVALEASDESEIEYYLDTETGEIIPLDDDFEDEKRERIEADFGERYLHIEPLDSHESFRIMEDFAASLPESPLRSCVFEALSRNKPFRRFKDVVHSDLAVRTQWFAFHDEALARYARDWLEAKGIEVELPPRQN